MESHLTLFIDLEPHHRMWPVLVLIRQRIATKTPAAQGRQCWAGIRLNADPTTDVHALPSEVSRKRGGIQMGRRAARLGSNLRRQVSLLAGQKWPFDGAKSFVSSLLIRPRTAFRVPQGPKPKHRVAPFQDADQKAPPNDPKQYPLLPWRVGPRRTRAR